MILSLFFYLLLCQILFGLKDRDNLQKIDMFKIYKEFQTDKFFTFISAYDNDDENIKKFSIHLPVLTIYELKKIIKNPDEETWAEIVFGEYGSKIRPDVLRYIHKNKEDIGSKLINLPN